MSRPPAAPLVAIPAYHLPAEQVVGWSSGGYAVPDRYIAALRRAGVQPVLVPADDVEVDLRSFAGLFLAGGGDIDPARYGATEVHPSVYGVDPARDAMEIDLVHAAIDQGVPLFAVCRGCQLVNVALGGSLHQHLPDRVGLEPHGDPLTRTSATHPVRIDAGTRLSKALGGATDLADCTSFHHQAIDDVGDGLAVVARAGDGVVEALELSDERTWLLAVQWHPEMTAAVDPDQQRLFDAFAAEVGASR
jgi:putative glutamine amidotransferase